MGDVTHTAIILTSKSLEALEPVHRQALEMLHAPPYVSAEALVSPLQRAPLNGYASFAVFPCGGKITGDPEIAIDAARDAFVEWLFDNVDPSAVTWVVVRYGGNTQPWIEIDSEEDAGE